MTATTTSSTTITEMTVHSTLRFLVVFAIAFHLLKDDAALVDGNGVGLREQAVRIKSDLVPSIALHIRIADRARTLEDADFEDVFFADLIDRRTQIPDRRIGQTDIE